MPRSPKRKAETRERIVDSARRLFKRHGYNAVAIDDIMAGAGLTRGGFYAYFSSKEELFREVVGEVILADKIREIVAPAPDRIAALELVLHVYVSEWHREAIEEGCPVPALSAAVSRSNGEVKQAYAKLLEDAVTEIAIYLPDQDHARARAEAIMAMAVGAVTCARALNGHPMSESLLDACRKGISTMIRGKGPLPTRSLPWPADYPLPPGALAGSC